MEEATLERRRLTDRSHRIRRLADGRVLVLRHLRPADGPALLDLYERLDADDRYRRFFGGFRPDERFTAREAAVWDRGGVGVVVEVVGADGDRSLVAAATAEPLPDGDGELAVEVDPAARGWMGAYVLDALLRAAAEVGMQNLQADVLCANTSMLALLRHRGFVVVGEPDGSTMRVAIGAAGRTPAWPRLAPRPRVLGEVPGGRWRDARRAAAGGGTVLTCPGPSPQARWCPLLAGQPCPLVAGADVVVCRLRADVEGDAVREGIRRLHPSVEPMEALP